ncbi:unnamed protein product [Amoebophrya sp. A120]|nr:unnamed protein product [Amoebophrya sp. A120]|eukprot:GSA120T00021573001.1
MKELMAPAATAQNASAELLCSATSLAVCVGCGAMRPRHRCSGCRKARYCSRECQLRDWKRGHSRECSRNTICQLRDWKRGHSRECSRNLCGSTGTLELRERSDSCRTTNVVRRTQDERASSRDPPGADSASSYAVEREEAWKMMERLVAAQEEGDVAGNKIRTDADVYVAETLKHAQEEHLGRKKTKKVELELPRHKGGRHADDNCATAEHQHCDSPSNILDEIGDASDLSSEMSPGGDLLPFSPVPSSDEEKAVF